MTRLIAPSFVEALLADGPAPDRAAAMELYGRFVGRWDMEVRRVAPDGQVFTGAGEIHFAWTLQGRAVQDVWITPPRFTPPGTSGDSGLVFYGTTLRVYDPGIAAWHIFWHDPIKQLHLRMVGRAEGREIVQHGTADDGTKLRWRFTDITPSSSRWLGERGTDTRAGWRTEEEFRAHRV
jgi:hypothetical protein